jgi:hypothetical protein
MPDANSSKTAFRLLAGLKRVAMEYSPNGAIPYVAHVDAGTIELVKKTGVEVVSSGDLIQRFAAIWDDRALETKAVPPARAITLCKR